MLMNGFLTQLTPMNIINALEGKVIKRERDIDTIIMKGT